MYALEKFKNGDLELAESAKNGEERAYYLPFSNSKLLDSDLLKVHTKKRLGAGNFGIVCEGEYEGRRVAVKTLKDAIDFETLQAFFKELKIMDYVGKHENIVELIGAEVSGILNGKVRAVLEYCPHGCLEEYLKKQRKLVFSHCAIQINSNNTAVELLSPGTSAEGHEPFENFEPTVQLLCHWSYQISRAMSFLASKGVVHGDLATRNVLVFDNYVLKLADFGMSRNLYNSAAYFQRNSNRPLPWRWLSPEVLEDRQFSVKSDVWSYGVTLWEIFELAKIPYPNLTWDLKFVNDLKNGSLRLPKPELMPQLVYNAVVLRCFETNFENRVDFRTIEEYWNQYFEPEVGPETYIGRGLSETLKNQFQTIQRTSKVRFKKEVRIDYYRIPIDALHDKLGSHPMQGLSNKQVERNKTKFGGNSMSPLKQQQRWLNFIKTLVGGFQLLLWTSSILSFAAYTVQCLHLGVPPDNSLHLYLGGAFAFLAIVLGCFAFCQEYSRGPIWKSSSKSLLSSSNYCIRNGHLKRIDAAELVVGDIVKLKSGDRIPADVRLIDAFGFKVDNSSVTGQLDPQLLIPESTYKNALGARNLAFASTNVLEGTAKGIVVAVGDNTCLGRVVGLTSDLNSRDSPLAKNALRFIISILVVAVFVGVAFFVALLLAGFELLDSCLFSIGIIVATVPVGLSVSFPAILAMTAKRLAKKGCAVKKLYAAETLGSTTVICFDKTGTLTGNRMTVSHLWFGNKIHDVAAGAQFDAGDAGFGVLVRAASLCSRATFSTDQQDVPIRERKVYGDASEAAILRFFEENIGDVAQYRAEMPKVFEIPFDSTNKWQLSVHEALVEGRKKNLLVMKGAPEIIIEYCSHIAIGHKDYDMNSDLCRGIVDATCAELGGMGERMLGFCDLVLPEEDYPIGFEFTEENTEYLKLGLRFVGIVSMKDPLRPGARETVEACRSAGIKVVMMTGDHASTSTAIAKKVGIISPENETLEERANRLNMDTFEVEGWGIETIVVTGEDLAKFSGDHLEEVLRNHSEIVFARVSSQQKLLIVEGFQRLNEVVAVAGDGVNDCPALKKADIGIAMGIAGSSDVAKQTADMILLNDDLRSILTGIEEGRSMFEKLVKCVRYLLAFNIALLAPFFVFILLAIPLPLDMIPLMLLSLGTGIVPTLSLLYEKPAEDLMKRPPRDSMKNNLVFDSKIPYSYLRFGVIESAAGISAYFMEMSSRSLAPKHLMGVATMWDDLSLYVVNWDGEWIFRDEWKMLEFSCWSYYFCAVVLCQWVIFLLSMAARVSFIEKLHKNRIIFSGIFVEAAIAVVFTYMLSYSTKLAEVSWIYFLLWLTGVSLCLVVILHDVIRKLLVQKCAKK